MLPLVGIFFFILKIICTFFMVGYAGKSKNPKVLRIISLVLIFVMWFVPFGVVPGLIWGGICWSDSRADRY